MRNLISRVLPVAIVVAGLIAACDQPGTKMPTGPSAPYISGVLISGPPSIAPGQSAQLGTTVALSDAAAKLSNEGAVRWRTSNAAVLNVTSTGLATAGNSVGEAVITADVVVNTKPQTGSREIVITPDGTYRLVGAVTENESPFLPVVGARVEVMPNGPSTVSDFGGKYRLYGVPPSAQIRVSADNYSTDQRTLSLTGHSTQNFQLTLTGPRLALSGNYVLSLDADSCPGSLPLSEDLRHRSYLATLSQNGLTVDVTLTEPRFFTKNNKGNRFSGQLISGGARFSLDYYDSYYYFYYGFALFPSVAEKLGNGTVLVPSGTATVTGSASGFTGTLNGSLNLWDSKFPSGNSNYLGGCFSNLRFSLTPR